MCFIIKCFLNQGHCIALYIKPKSLMTDTLESQCKMLYHWEGLGCNLVLAAVI